MDSLGDLLCVLEHLERVSGDLRGGDFAETIDGFRHEDRSVELTL